MEISVFACNFLYLLTLFEKMQSFQSMLQAELNTFKKSSTFEGKCA